MPRRPLLVALSVLLVMAPACGGGGGGDGGGGGGGDAAPSATLSTAPTSTTSTTVSVEAEVEAAYLKSWDVYADAVLTFDTSKLESSYHGPALEFVREDVKKLKSNGTPARMAVEHNYEIEVSEETGLARVIDRYQNHSVLVDAETGDAIEDDPDELINEQYLLQEIEGVWKVIDISRS